MRKASRIATGTRNGRAAGLATHQLIQRYCFSVRWGNDRDDRQAGRATALGQNRSRQARPTGPVESRQSAIAGCHENSYEKGALPMQRCQRLPADTAPVRTLGSGEAIARLGWP